MSDEMGLEFKTGRFGRAHGEAGVSIHECLDFALASVIAKRCQESLAMDAAGRFGVRLPVSPAIASGGDMSFVWSGPGHWLAMAEATRNEY